jgi:FMN phosphatase YigB (HAD superfamily)
MLIFDFDGVVMNSIDEITVTANNAITGNLAISLESFSQSVVRIFQRNRFHVQAIGDTLSLMQWCVENGESDPDRILSKEDYEMILQYETEPLLERMNRFFAARNAFVKKDEMGWFSLNAPYRPLWQELQTLSIEQIILLTNKNREAVLRLCHHFGLMLDEKNVYSGDAGVTKFENLHKIHERFHHPPYDFVDDSLKNLHDLDQYFNRNTQFIRLILAMWGYVGPEDGRMAKEAGYSALQQEGFITFLKRARLPMARN